MIENENGTDKPNGNGQDKGVPWIVFSVVFLAVIVSVGYMYIDIKDDLKAHDAYRVRELLEQRNGLKAECDENLKNFKGLIAWGQQQKNKPPIEMLIAKECRLLTPIEQQPKEGAN